MTSLAHAAVPVVTVDIAPVHSLVAQVMGELGEPNLALSPGASPHGYSMRPSEAQAVQDADIVFWTSASLTPWLSEAIGTLAPDAKSVELLELPDTTTLVLRESALFEAHGHDDEHSGEEDEHSDEETDEEDHDEEKGHGHETQANDPHAWLAPSNAAVWLDAIAAELSTMDPENANTYASNAASGKVDLKELEGSIEKVLEPARDHNFIVFHDAYQYFETAFDFPASGAISISDASKPGPARLQEIRDRVKNAYVRCVLSEPQFNTDLIDTVLDGTDARSAVLDPLGSHIDLGPELYPRLMQELAQTLADCLV